MRALWAAVLCALLHVAAGDNHTTEMILVKYDLTRFPYAVCNDGTAGAWRTALAARGSLLAAS